MKIIGKPYSGKPNVRFDEGELEIEQLATTPALYSTEGIDGNSEKYGMCQTLTPPKGELVLVSFDYMSPCCWFRVQPI